MALRPNLHSRPRRGAGAIAPGRGGGGDRTALNARRRAGPEPPAWAGLDRPHRRREPPGQTCGPGASASAPAWVPGPRRACAGPAPPGGSGAATGDVRALVVEAACRHDRWRHRGNRRQGPQWPVGRSAGVRTVWRGRMRRFLRTQKRQRLVSRRGGPIASTGTSSQGGRARMDAGGAGQARLSTACDGNASRGSHR